MKEKLISFSVVFLFILALAGCKGDTGPAGPTGPGGPAGPSMPIAVPGANQYVLPGTLVWLDGSGSFDPDGDALTYAWTFVSKPSTTATLSSSTIVNPDFYADALGQYVISLTVDDGLLNSATKTMTVTARIPVPDTGQTANYTETFGEDSDYALHPMSYTDNGDGTIRDNVTGLIWQKCSMGNSNVLLCSGTATTYNWYQATGTYDATYNSTTTNVCGSSTLAGGGWRLPTEYELETIVDFESLNGPTINFVYFTNTQSAAYWSSTTYAADTAKAWYVFFSDGEADSYAKTSTMYVRCVRGQQNPSTFIDNGNGTITDVTTNLMWQKCSYGQNNDSTCSGTATVLTWDSGAPSAISYCEGLSLGGFMDWRLPKIKELQSIVDMTRATAPTINTTYFPNTQSSGYWSSTTVAGSTLAWFENFASSFIGTGAFDKTFNNYVRCVRGGQ